MKHVDVAAERLAGFLQRFADRHGNVTTTPTSDTVTMTAADGAVVECRVPFPPLVIDPLDTYGGLVEHVTKQRRVGVLLVRRGGYAAGVFDGTQLVASKVGSRYVQSRTAAGGWSQQRFARRREGQTRQAIQAATEVAVQILGADDRLDAVVAGGDRTMCDQVLVDPRLTVARTLLTPYRLDVPDPRQRVLLATPSAFRSVRVTITEPAAP